MDKTDRPIDVAREIVNESGRFEVDQDGRLIRFCAAMDNDLNACHWLPMKCQRAVEHLHIPEGVRSIGNELSELWTYEAFDGVFILEDVSFPRSLHSLRYNVFHDCYIHDVVLPPSLRQIGGAVFMHCIIDRLEIQKQTLVLCQQTLDAKTLQAIPESELYYELRCFKESLVREVRADNLEFERCGSTSELQRRSREELLRRFMRDADIRIIANPVERKDNTGILGRIRNRLLR